MKSIVLRLWSGPSISNGRILWQVIVFFFVQRWPQCTQGGKCFEKSNTCYLFHSIQFPDRFFQQTHLVILYDSSCIFCLFMFSYSDTSRQEPFSLGYVRELRWPKNSETTTKNQCKFVHRSASMQHIPFFRKCTRQRHSSRFAVWLNEMHAHWFGHWCDKDKGHVLFFPVVKKIKNLTQSNVRCVLFFFPHIPYSI